ncbi:Anti-sigma B factor antagonist RsbV [Acidisarcina polymorpha]|uniref:Anti-sigma factor antagonist n=1 Tax=Acidisarcina polymorpha TaxID=2211140 RepID=A0A2Z5FUV0_9BACT|nr:STAS domain-containing protein [Acidisarcina polymorpha]AXC10641.1 Anti-sigma B factor antagonist RsbV [Acidisarcina polymorpha]
MQLDTEVLHLEGGIVVLVLKGRLTLGSRLSLLEAEITSLADGGAGKVILDLQAIEYADSAALGVLIHASSAVRSKGGQLQLAAPNQRLQDLFKLTNTAALLTIYPDRAACISHLQ